MLPPEKKPVKIPISVIPICTVDRKLLGDSLRCSAILAAGLFLSLSACKRAFLLETIEISEADRIPFKIISTKIIIASVSIMLWKNCL
ncbi:hypothetical protein D3C81_1635510 [compost metagenome]